MCDISVKCLFGLFFRMSFGVTGFAALRSRDMSTLVTFIVSSCNQKNLMEHYMML